MKFPYQLIVLCYVLAITSLTAQPVEILSYESIPSRIRHSNPTLAAAKLRIDEAVGRMKQSGRLQNPNFDTGTEHNSKTAEGRIEIGFSQKFPLTNRLALEKEITLAGIEAAESEMLDVERQLVAEARSEFVRVLSIRERKALLTKQRDLAEELAVFISDASQRGEISSLDAASARLSALSLTTNERLLEAEEITALGKLRPLVGIAAEARVKLSGNAPAIVIPSITVENRPDLNAAKIDLRASRTGIELEQARRRDDIEASLFVAGERNLDAPNGLQNEGIIGIKFSIPLPFWNNNQGSIDEATARSQRKAKEVEALTLSIRHESQTALTEMRQWAELITELDQDLLPLAEKQTKLLEESYRTGQGQLQAVLNSREQTLKLLAAKLDATREFQLARIRYQAASGSGF